MSTYHSISGIFLPAVISAALLPLNLFAQVQFLGVASGDTSSTSAILWTRAVDPAAQASVTLQLEVAIDLAFANGFLTINVVTNANADFTVKQKLTGLTPATNYFFRFRHQTGVSDIGAFKTAPSVTDAVAVRCAFSGDCDGKMRPFPLATHFPQLNLDYFVFLGDTMYETASTGSPAASLTGTLPAPSATGATRASLLADYSRKYRENCIATSIGGQKGLQPMFRSQANYTLLDNHELGGLQYIHGGAAPGTAIGDMPTGAGVDARLPINDSNATGAFMNQTPGFQTLIQVYMDHHPITDRTVDAPTDPRSHGTKQLYLAQQWGQHSILITLDDRSYRDIRMKTPSNLDDTSSPRADNPARTMLGVTQLEWLKQTLLNARDAGVIWKFIAVSTPIDQIGAIGSTTEPGKSWMGQYRFERNQLLKFIADNHIENVVFLSTDDHQTRINELLYSPTNQTALQSSYVIVPRCFSITDGPLGATGPDAVTDHSFASLNARATATASTQLRAGLDPIGLSPSYPGLRNVTREGDPNANLTRTPICFYSPDTFNLSTLDISANGATLSVALLGINSSPANSFGEYDRITNPVRPILSFAIDAFAPCANAPCGQFNSACVTLAINNTGRDAQGPIAVSIPLGDPLTLGWTGSSNQILMLVQGLDLIAGQRLFGNAIVDLDLTTAALIYSGFDPVLGPLFTTNSQGLASQSFAIPANMHGGILNLQGLILDPTSACSASGFMTTASFIITL
jgi:phosphodiesterase/alkaline phosphatase D-like protein